MKPKTNVYVWDMARGGWVEAPRVRKYEPPPAQRSYFFPRVLRSYPNLVAKELVSVQPMVGRGQIVPSAVVREFIRVEAMPGDDE
jgi:hypothetical protein